MTLNPTSSKGSGGGGSGTVTAVSSTNTAIAVATPTTTPALTLATLDVIAADGPASADWSNNSKKITSLANGSGVQDAAAFGQIPTALPPNGAAGGDLTGTYPNPTIGAAKVTVAKLAAAVTLDAIATANPNAANVPWNAKKITGLAVASAATDAASLANTLDQFGAPAANVAFNAKKITGLANGALATDAAALGQLWANPQAPAGALFETVWRQRQVWANNGILNTTRLSLIAINLPGGVTITSISFVSGDTAAGTPLNQVFGLFDGPTAHEGGANYALLRGTSDDTTTPWNANTVKTLNLTSTYTTVATGMFYLGILVVATTVPTLRSIGAAGNSNVQGIAPITEGSSNTGITALPNPATAPTAVTNQPYAYVS